jgi:hypothetical protein
MARVVQELTYRLVADEKNLVAGLKKADQRMSAVSANFTRYGAALTKGLTLPIVGVGAALIKLAADAEETDSKFNAVFKDQADIVRDWSEEYSQSVGRSATENRAFLATIQDTLVPLGFMRDAAADMSMQTIELATDLASFNNLPTSQVIQDIQSALVGNTETLRKYGVVANQSAIVQEALTAGLIENANELDATSKAQAIYNLIVQGTTDAQGDALRTAGSATNQLRALKSETMELGAELGTILLPAFTEVVQTLRGAVGFFADLDTSTQKIILSVAGFAAALGPAVFIVGKTIAAVNTLKFALIAMRTAGLGPLGLAITGITAVIGGLVAGFAAISNARHEENIERIRQEYGELADEIGRTAEEVAVLEEVARASGARLQEGGVPEAIRQYDELIKRLDITVDEFEAFAEAADNLGADVDLIAQLGADAGLTGRELSYAAGRMAVLAEQGYTAEQAAERLAHQLHTTTAAVTSAALQNERITGELRNQLETIDEQNQAYRKQLEYALALDAGLAARIEHNHEIAESLEAQAQAAADETAERERQARVTDRYLAARQEVLAILEDEKTEYQRIGEQIEYLENTPWGTGELEEDRLAAISALRAKQAEIIAAEEEAQAQKTVAIYKGMYSQIGSIFDQVFENYKTGLDLWYNQQKAYINDNIADEEEREKRLEELEKQKARKAAQIARAEAVYKKANALAEIAMNTAASVSKVLWNPPLAIAVGALGAVQAGLVLSEPLPPVPNFADGGAFTVPPGYANDSYPLPAAMLQSGERVTVETPLQQAAARGASAGGSGMMTIVVEMDGRQIAAQTVEYINDGQVRLEVGR